MCTNSNHVPSASLDFTLVTPSPPFFNLESYSPSGSACHFSLSCLSSRLSLVGAVHISASIKYPHSTKNLSITSLASAESFTRPRSLPLLYRCHPSALLPPRVKLILTGSAIEISLCLFLRPLKCLLSFLLNLLTSSIPLCYTGVKAVQSPPCSGIRS